ncbi:MAG: DNA replication/repair protein RecF [Christensenellales bacterium]
MKLKRLTVINFRNYKKAVFVPGDKITILAGENAQGKTNLLEAAYLCCTARSHRTNKDADLIRFEEPFARVKLEGEKSTGSIEIDYIIQRNGKKGIRINGKSIAKLSSLMGLMNAVMFSPEDLLLLKQGPALRRRFMDMGLSQINPSYFFALNEYNRALLQRNQLIKKQDNAINTLDIWEEQLAQHGNIIMELRRKFIDRLEESAKGIYKNLSSGKERLHLSYQPNTTDILETLHNTRAQDMKRGITSAGPHRDDLACWVNEKDARVYASQGQQRSIALSLKLAQLKIMEETTGETPILLLDDVLSELDTSRQAAMFETISGAQTIITCTNAQQLTGGAKCFKIENGSLIEGDAPANLRQPKK